MKCPYCGEAIESPTPGTLLAEEFFSDAFEIDVSESVEHHVQLECPECDKIMGYLGLSGAIGGEHPGLTYGDSRY